ncbi:MAG: glycosyltransferase family 4 protein [bacterium]|nr:glycosyltransferase family 4 protein [bacterium]
MKILLIFPLCPLPLNSGGQVRVWNIAKNLSKYHEIDLLCFIRNDSEKVHEEELKTVFGQVFFIKRTSLYGVSSLLSSGISFLRFFIGNFKLLIRLLKSDKPLLSLLYESNELRSKILKFDSEKQYDLFYAETFYGISSLCNDLEKLNTKLLLVEQNIEYLSYARQSVLQKNPLIRKFMEMDIEKIKKIEKYFWSKTDLLGALSLTDKNEIEGNVKRSVLLLENGVDIEFFSEQITTRVNDEVLFVGSFKYFPNVDALKWLLDKIWLRIIEVNPSLNLLIVGRGADENLKKYVATKGFVIDETVDDIRTVFQRSTVLAAPLRAGSGTKYKVLESMVSKLPVVTTTIGMEGLGCIDGKHIFIADNEEMFATAVLNVISSKRLRTEIASNGHEYVASNYGWNSIVKKFNDELMKVV